MGGWGGGTLTFADYRGSDSFLWGGGQGFKMLNFAIFYFFGVSRFCQLFNGFANLSRYFLGHVIFNSYFLGCHFKNVYFMVFLLYKVQQSFGFCLVNFIKFIFMKYN